MNAVDTNVWIYRYDLRDPTKQQTADQLLNTVRPLFLPWQIGCEFIAASRKLLSQGFDESKAWAALAAMQATASVILLPVPALWPETQALQQRHALSFWDALLVATCIRAGIQKLYTEDMGAPRQIETLSLINPFAGP